MKRRLLPILYVLIAVLSVDFARADLVSGVLANRWVTFILVCFGLFVLIKAYSGWRKYTGAQGSILDSADRVINWGAHAGVGTVGKGIGLAGWTGGKAIQGVQLGAAGLGKSWRKLRELTGYGIDRIRAIRRKEGGNISTITAQPMKEMEIEELIIKDEEVITNKLIAVREFLARVYNAMSSRRLSLESFKGAMANAENVIRSVLGTANDEQRRIQELIKDINIEGGTFRKFEEYNLAIQKNIGFLENGLNNKDIANFPNDVKAGINNIRSKLEEARNLVKGYETNLISSAEGLANQGNRVAQYLAADSRNEIALLERYIEILEVIRKLQQDEVNRNPKIFSAVRDKIKGLIGSINSVLTLLNRDEQYTELSKANSTKEVTAGQEFARIEAGVDRLMREIEAMLAQLSQSLGQG